MYTVTNPKINISVKTKEKTGNITYFDMESKPIRITCVRNINTLVAIFTSTKTLKLRG